MCLKLICSRILSSWPGARRLNLLPSSVAGALAAVLIERETWHCGVIAVVEGCASFIQSCECGPRLISEHDNSMTILAAKGRRAMPKRRRWRRFGQIIADDVVVTLQLHPTIATVASAATPAGETADRLLRFSALPDHQPSPQVRIPRLLRRPFAQSV